VVIHEILVLKYKNGDIFLKLLLFVKLFSFKNFDQQYFIVYTKMSITTFVIKSHPSISKNKVIQKFKFVGTVGNIRKFG
jgi:hypothetical protein